MEFQTVGKPIICCSNGTSGKYIQATKSGLVIVSNDLPKLIEVIIKLKNDEEICNNFGVNGAKFILKNQTFKKIGLKLKKLLLTLD